MKKPKTLKDVWYCYNGYCDSMCVKQGTPAIQEMVMDWIISLRQPEKDTKRRLQKSHRQYLKECAAGEHQEGGYDDLGVMLYHLPTNYKTERAQVKILKKIFNITEKDLREHK